MNYNVKDDDEEEEEDCFFLFFCILSTFFTVDLHEKSDDWRSVKICIFSGDWFNPVWNDDWLN